MADQGAPDTAMVVRRATGADAAAAARLTQRAFSAAAVEQPAVEDRGDGSGPQRPAQPPLPLTVVAEFHGTVAAVASANLRGQWFGGRRTLCAAVGGVAVDAPARGRGVGRRLMAGLLVAAHDAGATTSALFPSTPRFYAGLGYGVGGRRPVHALATAELRGLAGPRVPGQLIRRARPSDGVAVAGLVRQRAARGAGLLDHSGTDAGAVEDPSGPDAFVVEIDGVVRGWCALGRVAPSTRSARYDLVVRDLVGDCVKVELALWGLVVADHPSALRAEAVVVPGAVLEHLDLQREIVDDSRWMMRLVDVDAALAARGYPPGLETELALRVDDPVCPWNEGVRVLSVAGGTARVRPAPGAAPDLAVSAADLASLFTAHLDPAQAGYQGRLRATAEPTVEILRELFAGPPAWLARTF